MPSELSTALRGSDIGDKGDDVWKGSDRIQVDADNEATSRHVLLGDLKPSSRSGAEVDHASASGEEVVLTIEVDELAEKGIS